MTDFRIRAFYKNIKSRYLENETLFFHQIKKFINYTSRATLLLKTCFVAEVTFKIVYCSNCEPLTNYISDPALKCVVWCRNHPSILTIGEVCNKHPSLPFSLSKRNREKILWEIIKLETSKASKILIFPQQLSKIMLIHLLTSFLEALMILLKSLIFHPP